MATEGSGTEPDGLDWLAPIIGAIGGQGFADALSKGMRRGFGVDHVVVFTLMPNGCASTLATVGRVPGRLAARLAWDYAEANWFRRDPNLPQILAADTTPLPIAVPLSGRLYAPEYRRRFFDAADIVDKVAFSVRISDGYLLYANFHRLADTGRFDRQSHAALCRSSAVLAAALVRHRHLSAQARCLDASGPALDVLAVRERDVCSGILAGMTSEGIALHLGISRNTVLTLRRRAYARLGITSQHELVKLSLRHR